MLATHKLAFRKERSMKRNAFTLVELLICVAIIAILGGILFGAIGGCSKDPATGKSYYDVENTGVYRCVKTYTKSGGDDEADSKRVDLAPAGGGKNVTMECDDSYRADIDNSGELYAQFEKGKWYKVKSVGFRKTGNWNSFFPLVKSVEEVPDPTKKKTKER